RKRLFFFQAEDGIRVFHVTGVQTCALPICSAYHRGPAMLPTTTGDTFTISIPRTAASRLLLGIALGVGAVAAFIAYANLPTGYRSEERRVGKARSTAWRAYHLTKHLRFATT